jgi:methylmalonyl-CoA mutase C-terminal domain/subunit
LNVIDNRAPDAQRPRRPLILRGLGVVATSKRPSPPTRVLLAKLGLDGHDRGVKVVARALRDAGMEVIYTGMRQTPESVARAAVEEDTPVVGISLLSGAHMTLIPRLLDSLGREGAERTSVLVGGIIAPEEAKALEALGVAKVFGPGTPLDEIVAFAEQAAEERRGVAP